MGLSLCRVDVLPLIVSSLPHLQISEAAGEVGEFLSPVDGGEGIVVKGVGGRLCGLRSVADFEGIWESQRGQFVDQVERFGIGSVDLRRSEWRTRDGTHGIDALDRW